MQRYDDCDGVRLSGPALCSNCLSAHGNWVAVGSDEVCSFNAKHPVYHSGMSAIPWGVVVVESDERSMLVANMVGVKPHETRGAMPVEVIFERISEQVTLPKFRFRNPG